MRLSILLDGINPPPRFAVVKNSSIDWMNGSKLLEIGIWVKISFESDLFLTVQLKMWSTISVSLILVNAWNIDYKISVFLPVIQCVSRSVGETSKVYYSPIDFWICN
jgi:hypothetical protein